MERTKRISSRALGMLACLVLFGLLSVFVTQGMTQGMDEAVLKALRAGSADPLGPDLLPEIVRDITALGSTAIGLTALILATIWLSIVGKWRTALIQVVMIIAGIGAVYLMKHGFDRARPDLFPEMPFRQTASYPSGHTMTGTVVYLTMAMFLIRDQVNKQRRIYFIVAASLVAVSVGLSRVYLGAHFPTDVIAAWLLGAAWALGAATVADLLLPLGAIEPDDSEPEEGLTAGL